MNASSIILIILALAGFQFLAMFIFSKKNNSQKPVEDQNGNAMSLLLQQINELNRTVDKKMGEFQNTIDNRIGESSKIVRESLHNQFSESQKLIKDVTEGLTKLDETNRQVVSFADQLQSLQDILKNPKQRGVLGEYYLETLLKNVLPVGSFQMQYKLGKNEDGNDLIPDAVVFVKEKIIPIDSKFSLENYNRIIEERDPLEKVKLEKLFLSDLKNRILETAKYVQPAMGTMEFAFMFIPHEAIYYDLLVNRIGVNKEEENENLIQRAASKYKVIIVSPTSFLAYLQTVLQGLNAMRIEESAKDIIRQVGQLSVHLKKYEEYQVKMGTTLGTVVNHFNASAKEFKKIDKDVLRITGDAIGVDLPQLDKPTFDE